MTYIYAVCVDDEYGTPISMWTAEDAAWTELERLNAMRKSVHPVGKPKDSWKLGHKLRLERWELDEADASRGSPYAFVRGDEFKAIGTHSRLFRWVSPPPHLGFEILEDAA